VQNERQFKKVFFISYQSTLKIAMAIGYTPFFDAGYIPELSTPLIGLNLRSN
jgi:hypothetical protein